MADITRISGLTEETEKVYVAISKLNCIKPLYLCGGTSISLQLDHRLSEDLDFELIGTKRERPGLAFGEIISEVESIFSGVTREILGDEHFQLYLPNNVKLSFFRPENAVPSLNIGYEFNNIKAPTLQELLGMIIYTTTVRSCFRDYYDIYCLLEEGMDFKSGLDYALNFSRHTIHTKQTLSTLITPQLFVKEKDFDKNLKTKHIITPEDISDRIKTEIRRMGERLRSPSVAEGD